MTRTEKMQATIAANREAWESQTITIDDRWQIIRADTDNWAIQFKGKIWGYYGKRLHSALEALPGAMLSEGIKPSETLKDGLKHVLECQKAILEAVLNLNKETI